MRARLRRLLDRTVEPVYSATGRHAIGSPLDLPRVDGFDVEQWVADTWADIATRHGIEDQP